MSSQIATALAVSGMVTTLQKPGQSGMVAMVGAPGPRGPAGSGSTPSVDSQNRATLGSDSQLYVPEWAGADPLAYYILAKS